MDTTRPPRVPVHGSPTVLRATEGATLQAYQLEKNDCSHHYQRSCSLPRSRRPTDAWQHSSNRSSSQPRASHNAHFLDGFNVADCFDVRAIPDPPSPCHHKNRHRRRVSSAVLRPMSSHDITNRENNACLLPLEPVDSMKASTGSRRKRKTLSHVPSPIIPYDEQARPDRNKSVSNGLRIDIYQDDNEGIIGHASPKRRKKRQSMLIPNDLPMSPTAHRTSPEVNMAHSSPPSNEKKKSFFQNFENMQKLRKLVRGYCTLSSDADPSFSNEAKEIQRLTGYALPRTTALENNCDRSKAILSNRRSVIQKIAPLLSEMEKRKERDTKELEKRTGCRVSKSERSGRYRYYDIESNQRVGSQEYKRRYISILEEGRPKRFHVAQAWMNQLEQEKEAFLDQQKSIKEMQQKMAFCPPRDNNLKRMNRNETEVYPTNSEGFNTDLDCGEKQSSNCQLMTNSTEEDTETNEIAEISEASSEDTDDHSRVSSRSTSPVGSLSNEPSSADEQCIAMESVIEARDDDGVNNMDSARLLPFPSRETASMDPEIAAAEKRLWERIDLALHEYSDEVMRIEEKKRRAEAHGFNGE